MAAQAPLPGETHEALARAWFGSEPAAARADVVDRLVEEATRSGHGSAADLSRAYQVLMLATLDDPGLTSPSRATLCRDAAAELRGGDWDLPAALVEAMVALYDGVYPESNQRSLDRLDLLEENAGGRWLPWDAYWLSISRIVLLEQAGRHADALHVATDALAMAEELDLDRLVVLASHLVAHIYLAAGDFEAVATIEERTVATSRSFGSPLAAVLYHLMHSYLAADRISDAQQILDDYPRLSLPSGLVLRDGLVGFGVALIHSRQGRHEEALKVLELLETQRGEERHSPRVDAESTWITAEVLHSSGSATEATERIDRYLRELEAEATELAPYATTQLFRVLSEIREGNGDVAGALDAIRGSQSACFRWVGDSVELRLQSLHRATAQSQAERQRADRREQALQGGVDDALTEWRGEAVRARRFAEAAHDLRNPLTGVIGMLSLLRLTDLNESQRQYADLAQTSADRLLALCNDILDLACLDAGQLELRVAATSLRSMMSELTSMFEPMARESGITLGCTIDDSVPDVVVVDRTRLFQIIANLVSNALKLTPDGDVTVQVDLVDSAVDPVKTGLRISVVDTGPGIPAHEVQRLFDEFTQLGGSESAPAGGLGLAIVDRLVTLMEGEVTVVSEVGRGSSFSVVIPLVTNNEDAGAVPCGAG